MTATLVANPIVVEFGTDLPIDQDAGGTTLVSESRWRLAIGWLFD